VATEMMKVKEKVDEEKETQKSNQTGELSIWKEKIEIWV
jgi:hypothetical protein